MVHKKTNAKVRSIWVFPKIGVPQNGWFMMENHIKMDDLMMIWGYHYFWKHPYISKNEGSPFIWPRQTSKTSPQNKSKKIKKELLVWSTPRTQDAGGKGIFVGISQHFTCHPGGLLASNFCNDVFYNKHYTSHEERLEIIWSGKPWDELPKRLDQN